MYTEKISLRLTPEDKEKLQVEADNKKIPLTTLIRNKVSGDELTTCDENKEFVPQLIYTDYSGFNGANNRTNLKLNSLDNLLTQAKKHITLPEKTSAKFIEFLTNPVEFVINTLYEEHSKSISFKISKHKLLELMEVDLTGLNDASIIFNRYKENFTIDDKGNLKSAVDIENYRTYTKTEADNVRLKMANDIVAVYENSKEYDGSITIGRMRGVFNSMVGLGSDDKSHSILIPRISWVLGKNY